MAKLKKFTLNLDIEVEAKNEVEAIQKICTPIYQAGLTYWAGNLEESNKNVHVVQKVGK